MKQKQTDSPGKCQADLAERKECKIGIMDNNESQRQAWEQVTKASDRLLEGLPGDDSTIGNLSAG